MWGSIKHTLVTIVYEITDWEVLILYTITSIFTYNKKGIVK